MTDAEKANLTDPQKAKALFSFVRDMSRLKYNIVTNIDKQPWTLYLDSIDVDGHDITVSYQDKTDTEDAEEDLDGSILLSVHKAEFQPCPEPPATLIKWLSPDWNKYASNVSIIDNQKNDFPMPAFSEENDSSESESFVDSEERVAAFNEWYQERSLWVLQQIKINNARKLFSNVYQEYLTMQAEAGNMELMVGNGFVRQIGKPDVCHPLLLKRARYEFDATRNTISIRDTDAEPEIYTALLQTMTDTIDTAVIRPLSEELHDCYYHPLDRVDTPDYLKRLTHNLCDTATFDEELPGPDDIVSVSLSPVFFVRRKIDGTLKAIDDIIKDIDEKNTVPPHLSVFIGNHEHQQQQERGIGDEPIEKRIARLGGESADILLAKEANSEQLEIAERIEQYDAVLVQGPPGTGKTHTIANLLGHFLSQGKSVLVTSQTRKALSVLKEQVPPSMQSLCVTVLDDTKRDMERSVNGISEHLSNDTPQDLKHRMDVLSEERQGIIEKLNSVRKRIFAVKYQEFKPIAYNGDNFSPSEMAKFVAANAETLSYIPGKVTLYCPLPLNEQESDTLYKTNLTIAQSEDVELDCDIPAPEAILSPELFADNLTSQSECWSRLKELEKQLDGNIHVNPQDETITLDLQIDSSAFSSEPHREAVAELNDYIRSFVSVDKWMIAAAVDGNKGSGYQQQWEMLITAIEEADDYAGSLVVTTLGKTVSVLPDANIDKLRQSYEKLLNKFESRGKVSKLELLIDKKLNEALSAVTINGNAPANADDCALVLSYLQLCEYRSKAAALWDALMVPNDAPSFYSLDVAPEAVCKKRIPGIRRYLHWYENEYAQLLDLIENAGLCKDALFDFADLDTDFVKTEKIFRGVQNTLPVHIEIAQLCFRLNELEKQCDDTVRALTLGSRRESVACQAAVSAIESANPDKYCKAYLALSRLYAKYDTKWRRAELLEKLNIAAPDWADAIRRREGIHGEGTCPGDIQEAWKWKQFAGIIDEITAKPFEQMQQESVLLSKVLREKTAELATVSAWYHLICRCTTDSRLQQALMGWKMAVKKIGKGTGKNAQMYRKTAQQQMTFCQKAVPAWIMPVSTAMESFNPAFNKFDILIVDEASQSDLSALALMYMAKKVIIVGDDKQVSPLAVGVDDNQIGAIRDMYIRDIIPLWQLYDAKTSLYGLANTAYKPLMLKEHFRCVPDIIGYCNRLSYDYNIRPLRDASSSNLKPAIVSYRAPDGQREWPRKMNPKEAEWIVALMQSCMEQAEYDRKTFGVISLLGDEQAKAISELIYTKINVSEIENRHILCGNAANFQGDERNVIFLSMVDNNEGDGPMRLTGEGTGQSTKQRYNVAVSRAKDQLWIVHSLDYTRDLKAGDMRRDLLEYAADPKAYAQLAEEAEKKSESPFEKEIAMALHSKGYHFVQQWEIGSGGYRIDIVVIFQGKKIAVECDGERWHSSEEQIRNDMARQSVLERMGWRFIRIRGSQYYRDPDGTMTSVYAQLHDKGIEPEAQIENEAQTESSELLNRIKTRAYEIVESWHVIKPSNAPLEDAVTENDTEEMDSTPRTVKKAAAKETHNAQLLLDLDAISKADAPKQPAIKQASHASTADEALLLKLGEAQIGAIDRREQSGIIWVRANPETDKTLTAIVGQTKFPCKFEARGAQITGNKPAWRIMIGN